MFVGQGVGALDVALIVQLLHRHLAILRRHGAGIADPLHVAHPQFALQHPLGVAHAVETQMADVGLAGDKCHGHILSHLLVAQVAIEDERILVGGAEAGGARHGADNHRAGLIDQCADTVAALFGVGEGTDAGGATGFGASPRHLVKGEGRAGADRQKVVTQGLAIGEGELLRRRLQLGQGGMDKADPLFLHMGFDGDRGLLALPPLDGNPGVGGGKFKVRLVIDENHLMLLAQFGLEFVGGRHAPETRADDDYRCHVQPPAFITRSYEPGSSDPVI